MVGKSTVGLARKVPQRPKVQTLAVVDNSISAVQIAEGRSLVAVGKDMVEMAVRGQQFRVSVGEEYHDGLGVRDAENAEIA